jgi:hypothetical protein
MPLSCQLSLFLALLFWWHMFFLMPPYATNGNYMLKNKVKVWWHKNGFYYTICHQKKEVNHPF